MKQIRVIKSITNRDEISLRAYFKDIYKMPLLTFEQEKELSSKIKKGDKKALDRLVSCNLRFVITVAKQYQGQGLLLSDLINEGNYGLIKSAPLYNPDLGYRFISYAVWWIRQAILQAIYNNSRTIRFPITHVTKLNAVTREASKLETRFGRIPTISEISESLDVSEDTVRDVYLYSTNCTSIDVQIDEGDHTALLSEIIPGDLYTDTNSIKESNKAEFNMIFKKLQDKEADILKMFFGIQMRPLALSEIGKRFGMSGERVRQLKEATLKKIKDRFGDRLKELL